MSMLQAVTWHTYRYMQVSNLQQLLASNKSLDLTVLVCRLGMSCWLPPIKLIRLPLLCLCQTARCGCAMLPSCSPNALQLDVL